MDILDALLQAQNEGNPAEPDGFTVRWNHIKRAKEIIAAANAAPPAPPAP